MQPRLVWARYERCMLGLDKDFPPTLFTAITNCLVETGLAPLASFTQVLSNESIYYRPQPQQTAADHYRPDLQFNIIFRIFMKFNFVPVLKYYCLYLISYMLYLISFRTRA